MGIGTVLFLVVVLVAVASFIFILIRMSNPDVKNKAGPDWFWRLGKNDPIRNLFFRSDGSLRRYAVVGWLTLVIVSILVFLWL